MQPSHNFADSGAGAAGFSALGTAGAGFSVFWHPEAKIKLAMRTRGVRRVAVALIYGSFSISGSFHVLSKKAFSGP